MLPRKPRGAGTGREADPFRLDGRLALVTGASRGLGRAIALEFARRGADLALVARGAEPLKRTAAAARRLGVRAESFSADLANPESLSAVFAAVVGESGAPLILVNAAGTTFRGPAEELSLADWRRVLAVNLEAPLVLSQCFARYFAGLAAPTGVSGRRGYPRRGSSQAIPPRGSTSACDSRSLKDGTTLGKSVQPRRPAAAGIEPCPRRPETPSRGKIVNICSLLSARARPTIAAYTASKTGLLGLTRSLAVEWAPRGINVNAIGPGYFATEMTAPLVADPKFKAWVESRAPLGRWGRPEDLVGAAVYLASPASDFVTGQILYVDGGWTAGL